MREQRHAVAPHHEPRKQRREAVEINHEKRRPENHARQQRAPQRPASYQPAQHRNVNESQHDIDHQRGDGNDFGFFRDGEWLTKQRTGYSSGGSYTDYHNSLSIENSKPAHTDGDLGEIWRRGDQWVLEPAGDPRVFRKPRHTLAWFDATLTTKLAPRLAIAAKSTRWAWLSSTGKSAYNDLASEVSAAWTVSPALSVRSSLKLHQCSYFPAVRNDWECLAGLGITYTPSPRWELTADILDHRGWNEISDLPDRRFTRAVALLGATLKL